MTPANAVTIVRILAAPLAFWMMLHEPRQSSWALTGLWFLLSSSDMLDGRLARKYGKTRSGAFLDPLADKVLVLGGIFSMVVEHRFPWIALALIAVREVAVSIFRSSYARRGMAVPASQLAKWKTFVQLAAVGWVVLPLTRDLEWIADITLWVGVAIGIISGVQYFIAGNNAATTMAD